MAFRSERAVIMRKLVELKREGCDVEVILSNADGDILAGLVSAGIPVHPFFIRAASPRPQVIVHSKFWLVDAKSTLTGARRRIAYAGSSNWRLDQQRSDDMLLRIVDDGVYGAYSAYWELIRSRAASDPEPPGDRRCRAPLGARGDTVAQRRGLEPLRRDAARRGQRRSQRRRGGLKRLHVEMTGAQTGHGTSSVSRTAIASQELPSPPRATRP